MQDWDAAAGCQEMDQVDRVVVPPLTDMLHLLVLEEAQFKHVAVQ